MLAVMLIGMALPHEARAQITVTDVRPQNGGLDSQVRIYGTGFETASENAVTFCSRGRTPTTIRGGLLENEGGTLTQTSAGLTPVKQSAGAFGDYDGNGTPDAAWVEDGSNNQG